MLCSGFKESSGKRLELKEVDARVFSKVLALWCGENNNQKSDWGEMQQLVAVADQFQIIEVLTALEDAMMEKLSVEVCVEMLTWSSEIGTMRRLEAGAREMMKERFSEVMATAGFTSIDEEVLRSILEDSSVSKVKMNS